VDGREGLWKGRTTEGEEGQRGRRKMREQERERRIAS